VFYLAVIQRILPEYERTKPVPELAARIEHELAARAGARGIPRVILFEIERPELMWYVHRHIEETADESRLLAWLRGRRIAFVITDAESFDRLRGRHPELDVTLLERRTPYLPRASNVLRPELVKDPGRDLVLFSNRPSRLGPQRRRPRAESSTGEQGGSPTITRSAAGRQSRPLARATPAAPEPPAGERRDSRSRPG
jgi:hypothetical protein